MKTPKLENTTPMMQQWHECKLQAKDALLFFQLGDFYEAFYEDAKILSQKMGLTLTQRQNIPMCGIPVHSCEQYLDKLIRQGCKVAIAEQVGDPQKTKGLVKREITRFVSPATVISPQLLQDKSNNFFVCLTRIGATFGLAIIDMTTSEFRALEIEEENELINEVYRLGPKEMLISEKFYELHQELLSKISEDIAFVLNKKENALFNYELSLKALKNHFQNFSQIDGKISAINASGSLLRYLTEELKFDLSHIQTIISDQLCRYMAIDRASMQNLDILPDSQKMFSLLQLLDQTKTPMGARLLANWIKHPLLSYSSIQRRQDAIEELTQNSDILIALKDLLSKIYDLQRLMMRIESGYASPRDLVALSSSLKEIPKIQQILSNLSSPIFRKPLEDPASLIQKIDSALNDQVPPRVSDGNIFRKGYHQDLDELREMSTDSKAWIARYQNRLREELNIRTLKVGYTKAFGYYIDVSKGQKDRMPDTFQRKQTLVNNERFISDELKHFEYKVLSAEEKIRSLESILFDELRSNLSKYAILVRNIAQKISIIDVLHSLAFCALEYDYVKPQVSDQDILELEKARHPIIEKITSFSEFIPNNTLLDKQQRLYLITGPNMAGKSTYIRQVALITLMAQIGSFVPAKKAHIGIVDKIFSRVGASDDLARGQSTFMVEMSETANILNNVTDRSLVILDEIGRGTSTYDGISIAWAVAEFLLTTKNKTAKTLFATHYWELTKLEGKVPGAVNYQVAVEETQNGIIFLRKIIAGGTDKSYGIHVAKLAGLPPSCIKKAESMLFELEQKNRKKSPPKDSFEQLPLFTPNAQNEKVLDEINRIDLNQITPIEAQAKLYDLQKKLLPIQK